MRGRGGIAAGTAGDEGGGWRPEDAFRSEAEKGALPPLNPPGEGPAWQCRAEASWGDDCRFVPPSPPHSALASLAMDGGECEQRREKGEKQDIP